MNDYILNKHYDDERSGKLWQEFHPVIPFAIIDSRITDLAIRFWEDPDNNLLSGYRRLEDIVRGRTGIDEHGAKLFSQAFSGPTSSLNWKDLDSGEQVGRVNLFTGVYMAYRNPRAHRELENYDNDLLAEFLLLNHLYFLERESRER